MADTTSVVKIKSGSKVKTSTVRSKFYDNYWDAYNSVFEGNYYEIVPSKEAHRKTPVVQKVEYKPIVTEGDTQAAVAEVKPATDVVIKVKKSGEGKTYHLYKKNFASISFAFIAVVCYFAMLVLNYIGVFKGYTNPFAEAGTKEMINTLIGSVAGINVGEMIIAVAIPATFALSVVLALVSLILCICAYATNKHMLAIGPVSLVALLAWIDAGVLMFYGASVSTDSASIAAYVNPMVSTGVQWGFYIGAVLLLVPTILGFFVKSKKRLGVGYENEK